MDVQHSLRDVSNYFLVPLDMLLASMSLMSNSLILIAVARTRSLQHPSLLLLGSLSITDLLWAMLSIIRSVVRFTLDDLCPDTHAVESGFTVFSMMATLGNLAIISSDRYLAVSKPMWYRSTVTRSKVIKKASVIWLFSAGMTVLTQSRSFLPVYVTVFKVVAPLFYTCCIVVTIASYVGIFFANRRHRQTQMQMQMQMQTLAVLKREKKFANTVGLILVVLTFTYIPALVFPLFLAVALKFSLSQFSPFRPFYFLLLTLNGLLNPLLNYGRNKDIRRAVRRLIRCPAQCVGRIMPHTADNSETNHSHPSAEPVAIELEQRTNPTDIITQSEQFADVDEGKGRE